MSSYKFSCNHLISSEKDVFRTNGGSVLKARQIFTEGARGGTYSGKDNGDYRLRLQIICSVCFGARNNIGLISILYILRISNNR